MDKQKKVKRMVTSMSVYEFESWRYAIEYNKPLQPEIAALLIGRAYPEYEEKENT